MVHILIGVNVKHMVHFAIYYTSKFKHMVQFTFIHMSFRAHGAVILEHMVQCYIRMSYFSISNFKAHGAVKHLIGMSLEHMVPSF